MTARALSNGRIVSLFWSKSVTSVKTLPRCLSVVHNKNIVQDNFSKLLNCSHTSVFNNSFRFISNKTSVTDLNPKSKEQEKSDKFNIKKIKQTDSPSIVLIDDNKRMISSNLEDAGKLAKKKGLFLIEVDGQEEGIKSGKQVYKLVSKAQFYGEDWKSKKASRASEEGESKSNKKPQEEKTVMMKSKIAEHDIGVKTKQILKLVEKGHAIKVFIGQVGDKNETGEDVYQVMENLLKDEPVRIVQKIVKASQIRFQILPPKQSKTPPKNPTKNKSDKGDESDDDEDRETK